MYAIYKYIGLLKCRSCLVQGYANFLPPLKTHLLEAMTIVNNIIHFYVSDVA